MKNLFKKMKSALNNERGFTILETLVAIFILTISLTGPLSFAQSGLRSAYLARDQITAFFLAQDAIETIKNMRDQNKLDQIAAGGGSVPDWLSGLEACAPDDAAQPCSIDTTEPVPSVNACVSGNECGPLYFDEQYGLFTYDTIGNETSLFTRTIYLHEEVEGERAKVVVLVTWISKALSGTRKIVVEEDITNWLRTSALPPAPTP